ncbi:MAG: deoxyribonuclease IV [Bacilli bacterium]|nr:deoxyribonuclease IV [Bacilli bacterium]
MNLLVGSHVSFLKEKQLLGCVEEALSYGANTFMLYTGAPQNTNRIKIDNDLTKKALLLMKENNMDINNIVVHAPYIINLGNNNNPTAYNFSISFLKQEVDRCEQLGITKLILHPGSHVGLGSEVGINNIIYALNTVINKDQKVSICIETMSGKGSEVGSSFNEIKTIIDNIIYKDKIMVCLDTCHLSDAGYDITNFGNIIDDFDKTIGLSKLACIHINDSKNIQGSKKDRHENIGFGNLGFDNIINIIYNDKLKDIPKILETPYITETDLSENKIYPPYKFEIEMIKNKQFNQNLFNNIRDYYKR